MMNMIAINNSFAFVMQSEYNGKPQMCLFVVLNNKYRGEADVITFKPTQAHIFANNLQVMHDLADGKLNEGFKHNDLSITIETRVDREKKEYKFKALKSGKYPYLTESQARRMKEIGMFEVVLEFVNVLKAQS